MLRTVRVLNTDLPEGAQVNNFNTHEITMEINVGDKFILTRENAYNSGGKVGDIYILSHFDKNNDPVFVRQDDDATDVYLDIEVLKPVLLTNGVIVQFHCGEYGIVVDDKIFRNLKNDIDFIPVKEYDDFMRHEFWHDYDIDAVYVLNDALDNNYVWNTKWRRESEDNE